MIVFENFQIDKDKILTGVVKSTVEGVFITSLSITTHDYYNKENDFVDGVKPNDTINVYLDSKSRPYGVIELIKTNNIDEAQE